MNLRILIHEDATLDLHEHCSYLAQNNQNSALQFFDAARQTFAALARMPGMGQQYESEDDDIINIRKWANGVEGGFVYGREAVREYWTNQYNVIQKTKTLNE